MKLAFHINYDDLTDRQLVELATKPKNGIANEEGIAFLLYNRYNPLLTGIYRDIISRNMELYNDCIGDLFIYLQKGEPKWHKLNGIRWDGNFGVWLTPTARRRFVEYKSILLGHHPESEDSVDEEVNGKPKIQVPDLGVEDYEQREMKVLLLEAIRMLDNADQRFVIVKRLRGYNGHEIADLLKKHWEKHGKACNKGKSVDVNYDKEFIPSNLYVNNLIKDAKKELKIILNELTKKN